MLILVVVVGGGGCFNLYREVSVFVRMLKSVLQSALEHFAKLISWWKQLSHSLIRISLNCWWSPNQTRLCICVFMSLQMRMPQHLLQMLFWVSGSVCGTLNWKTWTESCIVVTHQGIVSSWTKTHSQIKTQGSRGAFSEPYLTSTAASSVGGTEGTPAWPLGQVGEPSAVEQKTLKYETTTREI